MMFIFPSLIPTNFISLCDPRKQVNEVYNKFSMWKLTTATSMVIYTKALTDEHE